MKTLRATAAGPWGPVGSEIHVKEPSGLQEHYLKNGVLVEVDTYAGMTGKERAVARAEALGLDTKGTQKEIEARIEEHEISTGEPPSGPGDPATITPTTV